MLIAVDFDGTIVDNMNHKEGERYPPLFAGAKETIAELRRAGHKVMIFSCNNPRWIKECLGQYGIKVDYIWDGPKPNYDLLIDDRAFHFDGDWAKVVVGGSNKEVTET